MGGVGSRRGVIVAVLLGTVVALVGPIGRAVQGSSHPNPNASLKVTARAPYDNSLGRPIEMRIDVTNPRPTDVEVGEISQRLPASFSYVPDSTYGSIYDDPFVDGNRLRWFGRFRIQNRSHETFTLIFSVMPSAPGLHLMRSDAIPLDQSVGIDRRLAAFHLTVAAPTELVATPVIYGPQGVSNIPRISARLTSSGRPVPGQTIRFYVEGGDDPDYQSGVFLCSARTNADGVASCSSVVHFARAIQGVGYDAFFIKFRERAPHLYESSSAHAQVITDIL